MGFYWAFLFLPAADFFVGVDTFNSRDADYKVLRERYGGGGCVSCHAAYLLGR